MPKAPGVKLHSEYVVETNAKGQVTRVRSGKAAQDPNFNAMTYGNALQAFIRTTDDRSIAGVYRLSYDYDPKTQRVHRSVALIRKGGVNPKALGAVDVMVQFEKRRAAIALQKAKAAAARQPTPNPKSTANLPDLNSITGKH